MNLDIINLLIGALAGIIVALAFKALKPFKDKLFDKLKSLIGADATEKLTNNLGLQKILDGIDDLRYLPNPKEINDIVDRIDIEAGNLKIALENVKKNSI